MKRLRYKPKFDKLYYIIFAVCLVLVLPATVVPAVFEPVTLFITLPTLLFVLYFLVSPMFGYVELMDEAVYIKYGLILNKTIPYKSIRCVDCGRGVISESMMSLKNAMDHVTIKYNAYDVTVVSVTDNEGLITELNFRALFSDVL